MSPCPHCQPKPDPITCAHDFAEIELGGLGEVKRCRKCGIVTKEKQKVKRKVFRVASAYGDVGTAPIRLGDLIELEEVE